MTRFLKILCILCMLTAVITSPLAVRSTVQAAVPANTLDPTFAPVLAAPGTIKGIIPLAGGKVLVYGSFISIAGVPRAGIAVLNQDGTVDPGFELDPALSKNSSAPVIEAAALVAGGKILVGGILDWFNPDRWQMYLFRINPDGSLDTSFNAGGFNFTTGLYGKVTALCVDGSGRILVGGDFTAPHNRITRLNQDGSADASFNPGSGANGTVRQIAMQSTGAIILAGDFTTINDVPSLGVARLGVDGSFDAGFFGTGISGTSPGGLDPVASAIYVDANDSVLVGGTFGNLKGQSAPILARILSNGVVDTTFSPFVRGYLEEITSILVTNGHLAVGGWSPEFYFNGKPVNHQAAIYLMIYPGGSFISYHLFKGKPTDVLALTARSDGEVLAGGNFTRGDWDELDYPGLVLFSSSNMAIDHTFKPVVGGQPDPSSIAIQPDGKILTAGNFYRVNGSLESGLSRLGSGGSLDTGFTVDKLTYRMALRMDGKIVGTGDYATPDNLFLDTAVFSSDGAIEATASAGYATSLISQPDLKVIATQFHSPGVSRLGTSLTPDTAFSANMGSGISNFQSPDLEFDRINTAALQGGKIIAGGSFSSFSGTPIQNLVRLMSDGTPDSSFTSLPYTVFNFRSEVFALAVQPDNKILVGGRFSTLGGTATPGIARLNPDGSLDTSFASPFADSGATIYSLALQPDGKILVGGNMQIVEGGNIYNSFVRLNQDGSRDTTFNANVRGVVRALSFAAPSSVILAGSFDLVDGQWRHGLARYNVTLSMPTLGSNYTNGAPGSFFTLQAVNFLPNEVLDIDVNGQTLGNVTADASGSAIFVLDTALADPGPYFCRIQSQTGLQSVVNPTAPASTSQVVIQLLAGAPLREKDSSAVVFSIPGGTAGSSIWLPVITK